MACAPVASPPEAPRVTPSPILTGGPPCAAPFEAVCTAVDRYATQLMEEQLTPGMALAVFLPDGRQEIRTYGVADRSSGQPVEPGTRFQVGSISKTFTGFVFARLVDQGLFDPYAPIVDSLPWFRLAEGTEAATGHHLLTHTAGLPLNRDDIVGSPYMVWALREQRSGWPPGSRFAYSNIGYQVMHEAMLRLEDGTPDDIVRRHVFEPLGMRASQAGFTHADRETMAEGYQPYYDDRPWHPEHGLAEAPWHEYDVGDGNVVSTVGDLATFLRMLLRRGEGPEGPLLSEEGYARFLGSPGIEAYGDPRQHYGYGIAVLQGDDGQVRIDHAGGMLGHVSNIVGNLDTGHGVAAIANSLSSAPIQLSYYALDLLEALGRGDTLPPVPSPTEDRLVIPDAEALAGSYTGPGGDVLEIQLHGPGLAVLHPRWSEVGPIPLERHDQVGRFYLRHPKVPELELFLLHIERDENGRGAEIFHGNEWFSAGEPRNVEVPETWHGYVGHYRSYSPWLSNLRVVLRRGELVLITVAGPEASLEEQPLEELEPGFFRVGPAPSAEWLRFDSVMEGQALRAVWTGHPFLRVTTP